MKLTFPTIQTAVIPAGYTWGTYHPGEYPVPGRHMGCDFASYVGAPIYAAVDGTVAKVSLVNEHGYGRHVFIQHDGFQTLYAHLHTVRVATGDIVFSGEQIGEMGGDPKDNDPIDGASSGSHLHFEVILPTQPMGDYVKTFAGYTVDPMPWLMMKYGEPAKLHLTVLAAKGIRVRAAMSTTSAILGGLGNGERVDAFDLIEDGKGNMWAKLRSMRDEYAAMRYDGETLMGVIDPPFNPPVPPTLDEKAIRRDEIERMITVLQSRLNELA